VSTGAQLAILLDILRVAAMIALGWTAAALLLTLFFSALFRRQRGMEDRRQQAERRRSWLRAVRGWAEGRRRPPAAQPEAPGGDPEGRRSRRPASNGGPA
jgi:hypothetical protein